MTHRSSRLVRLPIWVSILIILASFQSIPANQQDIERLQKTAEQGDAEGQFKLGYRYHVGLGVAKDESEAVLWYRKAADQGHVGAQVSLGNMYTSGDGVPEDDREAVKWYRAAAEQGICRRSTQPGRHVRQWRGCP